MSEVKNIPRLRFPEFDNQKIYTSRLGDVTEVRDGTHDSPKYVEEGYPLITSKNLNQNGTLSFDNVNFISEHDFVKINKRSKVDVGDILFGMIGTIGNPVRIKTDDFAIKNVALIKEELELQNNFLLYYLNSRNIQKQFYRENAGGTQKFIALNLIRKLSINHPSLLEQQKIADFLTAVDRRIELLEKKKTLLETYKKGVMKKIFNQEIRFKDDNGSEFPDWEEKKLGEICDYKNGGSFEKLIIESGEFNLITLNSIDIEGNMKNTHKRVNVNDNSLSEGDLIMVLSDVAHGNFLGLTEIIPNNKFVLNQRMGALKPKLSINRFYLKCFINQNQKYFKLMGQGSSQLNLSKGDILNFNVSYPIINEQEKISNFFKSVDNQIKLLKTHINKSKTWKKGLLQKMFV